jgi:hypothetical protein
MNKTLEEIKKRWEESPLEVVGVASLAVTAIAKLIDSRTRAKNQRTWKREVARREKKTLRR